MCNHSGKKTRVEDVKSRVPFEKRKLDLSIFTFDESTNDQSHKKISQEDMVTYTRHMKQFENDEEFEFQAKFGDKFQTFCAKISAKKL